MATTKSSKRKKSTAKVAPTAAGEPRYLAVFNQLCQDITDGVYQVGELLPTEHELCDLFDVSRFTARNALSMLTDAGLVTRRPRVGSVVASQNRRNPYVQTLETVDDLLQYAESTRFEISHWETLKLDQTLNMGETQLCLTRVYLNPAFQKVIPAMRRRKNAVVYRWIEEIYGIKVARIEQRIDACSVSSADATLLLCPVGSPALRMQRLYFDANNLLLEISDSLHPSGRFSYHMSLLRSDFKP